MEPPNLARAHSQRESHSRRRWPAEWEPQQAVWFAWPHNRQTWPGLYQEIPATMAELLRVASEYVPVRILASGPVAVEARQSLPVSDRIMLVDIATNDCWIRDYGPTFVFQGDEQVGVDWRFDSWGGKYPPWDLDAAAGEAICRAAGVRHEPSPLVLEGGAIEGDGLGRLLTTPECIECLRRNPGWTRSAIASELRRRLGTTEILWLDGGGLQGDDTDGHVDQLARFVSPRHVVCAVTDDRDDPNHAGLQKNYQQLVAWGQETTPRVTVHRLPIPPARWVDGSRVPESYCNFLMLGDSAALVPTFGSERTDRAAIGLLSELLPGHELRGVPVGQFSWGLGAWHCASQQQPATILR